MSADNPVSRRLLLGRLGTGTGVMGTFLLPGWMHAAMAAPRHGHHHHRAVPHRSHASEAAPLVMLDPGHGGKDPGAIGITGTYEKYVALDTALELRRLLEASGRYRVAMTRYRDIFIPLEDRVAEAQKHGASLFMSMHADALKGDSAVRGASVYTLSSKASDAQSAYLARSENSADRYGGLPIPHVSPEVGRILASLVRRETRVGSVRLASDMVVSLDRSIPMLPNPERHAGFVVLKSSDIPSVLVEMGFMSNRRDEAALRRPAHRKVVAEAMQRAVDAFFVARLRMAAG